MKAVFQNIGILGYAMTPMGQIKGKNGGLYNIKSFRNLPNGMIEADLEKIKK